MIVFGRSRRLASKVSGAAIWGALAVLAAASFGGCAPAASDEAVGSVRQAYGSYDMVSSYAGDIEATRGWLIEWEIPEIVNGHEATAVVGQWYFNFESGVYLSGGIWHVYYFGDDNGLEGNEDSCDGQWGSGGMCHDEFKGLLPGQRVVFKYEWCTEAHAPDVNGNQLCLSVDLKDGSGFRFLGADARSTVEMYAHDIEHFSTEGQIKPVISCAAPTKMVRQQLKSAAGVWQDMSGAQTWNFSQVKPYAYQNLQLSASPAHWESCTPNPDGSGNGLQAEYFDNADLSGTRVLRTDPEVDFDWGEGSPDSAIDSDTFSVRWTGQVEPRFSETYTFRTVSDDGIRLWIDGNLLIDNWTFHSPTEDAGSITLQAGTKYDIELEYFEQGGGATARLYWSSQSQPREIIPSYRLYSSTTCAHESDAGFCARLGKQCGSFAGVDNCGAPRSVQSCGTCTAPETCGGGGVSNVCGASSTSCSGTPAWDPAKPWYEYSPYERVVGSNSRLYECHSPSFCYLDPAGPYSTYGFTDLGPC